MCRTVSFHEDRTMKAGTAHKMEGLLTEVITASHWKKLVSMERLATVSFRKVISDFCT